MKVWIHGYSGRMGQEIAQQMAATKKDWTLLGGTSAEGLHLTQQKYTEPNWDRFPEHLKDVDLLIDFSSASANAVLLDYLRRDGKSRKAVLVGSTGMSEEQKLQWKALSQELGIRVLVAANTSLGVLLTMHVSVILGKILSPLGFDAEILETHHRNKVDAPSGTALFLGEHLARAVDKKLVSQREGKRTSDEIGVSALRGGSVFGEHEIRFLGDEEELVISHRALSRGLFARGALLLAQWLTNKEPGFYRLEDVSIEEMSEFNRPTRSPVPPTPNR